jgi:glycosyltransferase involved in cell wall biosynthesis
MKKRRILIFSLTYYPRFVGGAEVAIKEVTDRIASAYPQYEFDMITLRLDRTLPLVEKIGAVTVHRIGFSGDCTDISATFRLPLSLNKWLMPFTAYYAAVKLHKARPYDAFWAVIATYSAFGALFAKLRFPKVPLLLSLQEGDTLAHIRRRLAGGLLFPLYRLIFRKADAIQTISHFLADFAEARGTSAPIEVIPNGVDFAHFSQVPHDSDLFPLRERLRKTYTDTFVVHVGRFVEKNGVDVLIEALPLLPHTVKLVLIGEGPLHDQLKARAAELHVEDRIHWLGFIAHKDLPAYLHVCDIFIRPSRSEGFGNVFVEAMAARLPVIATPVGGIVDFLKDKETGVFCEVDNPRSCAEAIELLIKNQKLREKIKAAGFALARDHYDWQGIAERMKDFFESGIMSS